MSKTMTKTMSGRIIQVTQWEKCDAKAHEVFLQGKLGQAENGFSGVSFLQSSLWGEFKQKQGWSAHYFRGVIENVLEEQDSEIDFCMLVLSRPLFLLSVAYIPFGPVFQPKHLGQKLGQEPEHEPWQKFWNAGLSQREYFAACQSIVKKLLGFIPLSCFFVRLDSNALEFYRPLAHNRSSKGSGKNSSENANGVQNTSGASDSSGAQNTSRASDSSGAPDASRAPDTSEAPEMQPEQCKQNVKDAAAYFGFYSAIQRVQVPDTVLLDLRLEEAELLAQMHKKHRYNIRLAEKKGVQVREMDWRQEQALSAWYELYQTTAQRDRIGIHSLSYYQSLFEEQGKNQANGFYSLHLYCAYGAPCIENSELENDCLQTDQKADQKADQAANQAAAVETAPAPLLAGIIVLHYQHASTATYLYGASSNEQRELMPNYLLQWHAISQARKAGLSCYDFFGIPPQDDPKNPMYGLYRFKVGFGGYAIRRSGAWDMPYSRIFYGVYRLLEYGRLLLYRLRHR